MDRHLISIMSVKGDIEGSLEFGVSEGYHTRLLPFMFITMNNGQVIVDLQGGEDMEELEGIRNKETQSLTTYIAIVKIQVNLDLLVTLMLKKSLSL